MKVLFAVSNENISAQIVKKYQREYKEIISYKNVYYFNAIVKELQRDKSYDRIVIGEDLEPFSSNNYDAIDKFIFEKLDSISDEATGSEGDIPILLLCSDRRTKSEPILVKIFGLGIYNALLTPDKTLDNVCRLLNRPRSKKDAKIYYKIDSEEVNYQSENEDNVSELEIQNILKHYKRIGRDEEKYIESFNNIAAQYNDSQLRIITKFLPLNVKAVLEERCPKYQSVMTFGNSPLTKKHETKNNEDGLKVNFLNGNRSIRTSKPIIVPTAVNRAKKKIVNNNINTEKAINDVINVNKEDLNNRKVENYSNNIVHEKDNYMYDEEMIQQPKRGRPRKNPVEQVEETSIKKKRGRPRKNPIEKIKTENNTKQGRGRPRKKTIDDSGLSAFDDIENTETTLPGFDDIEDTETTLPGFDDTEDTEAKLPGFDDIEDTEATLPGFDDIENTEATLPGFDDTEDTEAKLPEFDDIEDTETTLPGFGDETTETLSRRFNDSYKSDAKNNNNYYSGQFNNSYKSNIERYSGNDNYIGNVDRVDKLLSKDKKIVSFVGTTKNGTSFLVNNLAKTVSSMGIKTAIIDLTTNRNSYYIFTNNDEKLRGIAYESIKKLRSGIASGISVDRNFDVYTALPGDNTPLEDVDNILATLVQNYSLVIMDCDFTTPVEYFGVAQEIYIVQSLDILTIQPMTAFLRELKSKDILKEEKIRVVINKEVRIKGLTPNAIIGGLAFYNDPAMSFMTELFNKEKVKYITIPLDETTYVRYLENVMECEISTSGYSREFSAKIKELANMVYPLIGGRNRTTNSNSYNNTFSNNMNNTLEQMKRRGY